MEGEILKGHLDMLILASLKTTPRHGYAIIESLREQSGGELDLPEGTVYPVLHRLERRKLLASAWTSGGRRRRVYRLTAAGRRTLNTREKEWATFSNTVGLILGSS